MCVYVLAEVGDVMGAAVGQDVLLLQVKMDEYRVRVDIA